MKTLQKYTGLLASILLLAAVTAWPHWSGKATDRETAFVILRAIALAASLNILLGYTGYVSFGHIVFFGLGGYVGFYLISAQGMSIWVAMLAGGLAAAALAWALGGAILPLRGAYFALATIGINEAVRAFINNFEPFGGPIGMTLNFQVYKDYGGPAQVFQMTFWVMAGLAAAAVILSFFVKTSRFGLGLLAIREDEDAAEVTGVVTPRAKTIAYVLSAIIPGMTGTLFFFKNGFIEPANAFPLHSSIETIVMIMLGGQGTVLGPLLGAGLYQGLRGALLVQPIFKNVQLAVSGIVLLLIVLFIPRGLVGWLHDRYPKLRKVLP